MPSEITKDSFKVSSNGEPNDHKTRRALILMGTGGKIDIGEEPPKKEAKKEVKKSQ